MFFSAFLICLKFIVCSISMMLRNRKRQKLAKLKADEEERKKPKIIPHWKKAAMEALKQERERMEKENLDDDNQEEANEDEAVEVEAKPAYFNDFIAQAKRLDSSLKSSLDLDIPVQRQSSEGEDEAEVGEEIERRSLMRETMMMYRVKGVAAPPQPNMNPYEVLPGYSRNKNTLGSSISKSKSMSTNMSNMSNMPKMSMSMNLSIHQLGLANSRSMVLSQPVVLSPH